MASSPRKMFPMPISYDRLSLKMEVYSRGSPSFHGGNSFGTPKCILCNPLTKSPRDPLFKETIELEGLRKTSIKDNFNRIFSNPNDIIIF